MSADKIRHACCAGCLATARAEWKSRTEAAEARARYARRVLNERMEAARQEIVDLRTALHDAEAEVAKWRARYGGVDADPDQLAAAGDGPT